jgi:hypothetical protein
MKQNNMKRIFILISALFYLSSCEPTYKGKHRFRPNQVVYYRTYDDLDIILDTVRDEEGKLIFSKIRSKLVEKNRFMSAETTDSRVDGKRDETRRFERIKFFDTILI